MSHSRKNIAPCFYGVMKLTIAKDPLNRSLYPWVPVLRFGGSFAGMGLLSGFGWRLDWGYPSAFWLWAQDCVLVFLPTAYWLPRIAFQFFCTFWIEAFGSFYFGACVPILEWDRFPHCARSILPLLSLYPPLSPASGCTVSSSKIAIGASQPPHPYVSNYFGDASYKRLNQKRPAAILSGQRVEASIRKKYSIVLLKNNETYFSKGSPESKPSTYEGNSSARPRMLFIFELRIR